MSKPASNPKSDTAESAALEVFGLGFHYDAKAALRHVGFDVAAGRFKVLVGPNGACKSTLFSLITRLFESPSGTITVNRVGLREDFLQALARMGVVFEAPAQLLLLDEPTVGLDVPTRHAIVEHVHALARGMTARRGGSGS